MRDLVSVLVEPNRRRLLELLVEGEASVGTLAAHFGVTRSAISQHLGVLSRAGLVVARKEGRQRLYRLDPDGMARLRASLDLFWTAELEDLAAGRPQPKERAPMSLEKSVVVPLDPDATFALLTEPARLRRWQTVTARIDLRAGGEYRWTVVPGHTAAGTVTELEPGRRLVLGWGWEESDDLPPGASTVTITLEPSEGGTLVRLVHDGLPADEATGHGEGWDHFLDRLVRAARAGDAGPDPWAAAPEPMDRLSAAEASLAVCQRALRALTPDDAERPTPCAQFTVHELVEHLLGSVVHLGAAAGADPRPATGGTPEELVADAAQLTLEAWRARGTEGTVDLGGGAMPAHLAADILPVEFLVHAWDVATSTGRSLVVDDALSDYVLGLARELIQPPSRGERFAAEVVPGADADSLERLVAFAGRAVPANAGRV